MATNERSGASEIEAHAITAQDVANARSRWIERCAKVELLRRQRVDPVAIAYADRDREVFEQAYLEIGRVFVSEQARRVNVQTPDEEIRALVLKWAEHQLSYPIPPAGVETERDLPF